MNEEEYRTDAKEFGVMSVPWPPTDEERQALRAWVAEILKAKIHRRGYKQVGAITEGRVCHGRIGFRVRVRYVGSAPKR